MTPAELSLALTIIEQQELPLLTWGVVDGSFAYEELLALLEQEAPGFDPEELVDEMADNGLLVSQGISGDRYRTRMAETVRLAANLRQWLHTAIPTTSS